MLQLICKRLQNERVKLKMTQEELANKVGITSKSQSNYELGKRYPDAKYLAGAAQSGVDINYVVTGSHCLPEEKMQTVVELEEKLKEVMALLEVLKGNQ